MIGDCIETPHGELDKDGYPRAKYQGKLETVARQVMRLLYGQKAIEGKLICHTCGNRKCVNPAHLYIGDPRTNSDDKWTDGTMCVGEKHGRFKQHIKTEDIVYMYDELGLSQDKIAAKLGITQSAVSGRIRRYKKQKGTTDELA
jgi:hypothetical protein